jgi:hypothetical protein
MTSIHKVIAAITVLAILAVGGYYLLKDTQVVEAPVENARVMEEEAPQAEASDTGTTATFEGELEEVNTGCYADAECYVVVDGKHVTTLMGWSRDTVGVVDFDALSAAIGQTVEVYAAEKSDGTYTLYGNTAYYVRVK